MSRRLPALACLFLVCSVAVFSQSAPPAYVLPHGDAAVVVLGDTPRETHSFRVYRRAPGEDDFALVTPHAVQPVRDPYEAARLMDADFNWIARKMDSTDPVVVWRKLTLNENLAEAYSLISANLRRALGRTWTDTSVTRGLRYTYRVVMLDEDGGEVERYEREIRIGPPQAPPPPPAVEAVATETTVTVTWDYPAYRGGPDDLTVGFAVFRGRGAGGAQELEPLFPAPVLRVEDNLVAYDTNVRIGESYTYAVAAVDLIGTQSVRVAAPPVTVEDTAPPLVPTGLSATDRETDVLLIWKMSPQLDVTHYNAYRSTSVDEGADLVQLNTAPIPYDEPRFVDDEAPRGVPAHYWVRAVDRHGNESARAGPASIVAEDTRPPGAVGELAAQVEEETRTVVLTWDAPDDPDLAGYYVYRGPGPADLMRIDQMLARGRRGTDLPRRGYREQGLEPGKSLVYAVSAYDNSYNESPQATAEVLVPDNVAPDAPHGLFARPSLEGTVELSWQPLLARDLAGYRVYRTREVGVLGSRRARRGDHEVDRRRGRARRALSLPPDRARRGRERERARPAGRRRTHGHLPAVAPAAWRPA